MVADKPADKPHVQHVFLELDAMRGVAAICVMLYHYSPFLSARKVLPSAYLAVDMFFLLSGFIIAHAYRARLLTGMSLRKFAVIRIIRLYPLYILGTAVGLAYILARGVLEPAHDVSVQQLATPVMLSALLLPNVSETGNLSGLYPFDGAAWSLMFEMLVNLAYAGVCIALTPRRLRWVMVIGVVCVLASAGYFGSLDVGMTPRTLGGGMGRVVMSFTIGIYLHHLYRLHGVSPGARTRQRPRGAFEAVLVLLVCAFLVPARGWERQAMDLFCVLLLFPLVIWLGAQLPSPSRLRPLYAQAGRLSYAIYILHAPLLLVSAGAYKAIWHADPAAMRPYSGIAFAAISLVVAALAVSLFDEPVRRRLSRVLASRSAKLARPATALVVPK
jgi:peptidoglycan/LPS O-acetylase OafA/YrhL